MPRDFIPRRDADFLAFSANFSQQISSAPGDFGLSASQCAQYALTQQAFDAAYALAAAPGTRTVVTVRGKNEARDTLEAETRMLAGIIRAYPAKTRTRLADLHLNVPGQKRRQVPAPVAPPRLSIDAQGPAINLLLSDAESGKVAKPRDVVGAALMYFVGSEPPDDLSQWTHMRAVTKARSRLTFGLPPGTQVWMTAAWLNTRFERGPWCAPAYTYAAHAGPVMSGKAAPEIRAMKFAGDAIASAVPGDGAGEELKQAA